MKFGGENKRTVYLVGLLMVGRGHLRLRELLLRFLRRGDAETGRHCRTQSRRR